MGYRRSGNWLEFSWDMDNTRHGDDQLMVAQGSDWTVLSVADGVSTSTAGRLASALLLHHLSETLAAKAGQPGPRHMEEVEKLVTQAVSEDAARVREDVKELAEKLGSLHQLQELRGKKGQALKGAYGALLEGFNAVRRILEEWCKALDVAPQDTNAIKFLEATEASLVENEPDLAELPVPSFASDNLKQIMAELPLAAGETGEGIHARIIDRLNREDPASWDSTTTLCLALVFPEEQNGQRVIRLLTQSLGDSQIEILSPERLWTKHYEVKVAKLSTFVSSRQGIVGTPDIAWRVLYPGEYLILASDGANVLWTTPSGVEGVPFQRLIKQYDEKGNLEGLAESWLEFMRENDAILDDASLIVARVL